ncbi:AI-2E family transporter [Novosphingobium sp. ZN18A2]|uniref:AI-2E family transporter n=1 Tax=Novosphingobium sp. ZN18A2 TaxID=3079861 RepID=UPI0030D1D10E
MAMKPVFRPHEDDRPFLRRLAWTIAIAIVLLVVWRAAHLLMLAFGSVLLAVVFGSAGRLFQRLGVKNHRIALGLGVTLVLAVLGAIGFLLTVQFGSEIGRMLGNLPGTIKSIEDGLSGSPVGRAVVQAVEAATGGGTIANRLGDLLSGAGMVLVNMVIVIVGALFLTGNPKPYARGLILLTPPAARPTMERALKEMSRALRLWLTAKLLSMAAMTVFIGGALWMAGLKSWAALGLLGGLSEFVPYVGPAVAMVPSIGLAAEAGGSVLVRTLIAYVVVRLAEAWLLTPVINRRVINIPPAVTLFTILAVGAVFGVYGVFFAGALLVVTFVGVREFYLRDTLGESDVEPVPDEA